MFAQGRAYLTKMPDTKGYLRDNCKQQDKHRRWTRTGKMDGR
jgi:hypothetical protein